MVRFVEPGNGLPAVPAVSVSDFSAVSFGKLAGKIERGKAADKKLAMKWLRVAVAAVSDLPHDKAVGVRRFQLRGQVARSTVECNQFVCASHRKTSVLP